MPFGLIFGALFFLISAWLGLQLTGAEQAPAHWAGILLIALGLALCLGLLGRRSWARWTGAAVAAALAVFGMKQMLGSGDAMDWVLFLGAGVTALLLALPQTGSVTSGLEGAPRPSGPILRSLGWVTAVSVAGLCGMTLWAMNTQPEPSAQVAMPAKSQKRSVTWQQFGDGLSQSRQDGKLMLVSFNADWCGYCKKMERSTWKHPSVVERLDELVPVWVDIDDTRTVNGFSGAELAQSYRVQGTPTTVLLDHDGGVVARAGGYLSARDFLGWLDDSLTRTPKQRTPIRVSGP